MRRDWHRRRRRGRSGSGCRTTCCRAGAAAARPGADRRRTGFPTRSSTGVGPHVRLGGTVLLDDAYLPAIAAIVDYARSSDAWRVDDAVSFWTARPTKLADEQPRSWPAPTPPRGRCASGTCRRTAGSSPRRGSASSRRAGLLPFAASGARRATAGSPATAAGRAGATRRARLHTARVPRRRPGWRRGRARAGRMPPARGRPAERCTQQGREGRPRRM